MSLFVLLLPNVFDISNSRNKSILHHSLRVSTKTSFLVLKARRNTRLLVFRVFLVSVHVVPIVLLSEFHLKYVIFQKLLVGLHLIFLQVIVFARSLGPVVLAIPCHWLLQAYQSVVYHLNRNFHFYVDLSISKVKKIYKCLFYAKSFLYFNIISFNFYTLHPTLFQFLSPRKSRKFQSL